MAVGRLALANFISHRVRVGLTVAAIAVSVSLVVAVTSGYASVKEVIRQYLMQYMGTTDVTITRKSEYRGDIPETVLLQIGKDTRVNRVAGRLEADTKVLDPQGKPLPHREVNVVGVLLPVDTAVTAQPMEPGSGGGWFSGERGNVTVIDQEAAKLLAKGDTADEKRPPLRVGDTIILPLPPRMPTTTASTAPATPNPVATTLPATTAPAGIQLKLTIVGIVHKPAILAQNSQTIYVPLRTLQEFYGTPERVNSILIDLNQGVDPRAFAKSLEGQLATAYPFLKYTTARDSKEKLEQMLQGADFLSYMGGAISMLAATFIVFSTLSMGVSERSRILAMLRSIGAFRRQIAMLVIFEALLLASAGVAVGLVLGWIWIRLLVWKFNDMFASGAIFSFGGIIFAVVGTMIAALGASLLPAWSATRVSPLEGMTPLAKPTSRRMPVIALLIGLLLISIDPFLTLFPGLPKALRFYAHFAVGLPSLMLGFFLTAPACVWIVEKIFAWLLAQVFRVNYTLLRQQLTGSIWRAAGTAAALMVGLSTLVVLETNGNTMLSGWVLPDKFPDMFIMSPFGIDDAQVEMLKQVSGVNSNDVLPIYVVVPGVGSNFLAVAKGLGANSTMFFGVDPEKALRMMQLDFRRNDGQIPTADEQKRMNAFAVYKLNLHVVTLKDGTQLRGNLQRAGDTIVVRWQGGEEQSVPAAAGVMQAEGVTLANGTSIRGDVRQQQGDRYLIKSEPGESVPLSPAEIQSNVPGRYLIVTDEFRQMKGVKVGDKFPLTVSAVAGDVDYTIAGIVWSPGIDVMVSMHDMGRQFEDRSVSSVFGSRDDAVRDFGVRGALFAAVNLNPSAGPRKDVEQSIKDRVGAWGLTAYDVRHVKARIQQGFHRLLHLVSSVALAAIIVASLGVTNTIMASVRTRHWQLGILRSIGVTRGQVLRLILAEGILLGLVGCVLGLTAGLLMSVDANGLSRSNIGYGPSLAVPWPIVFTGLGIIVVVAFVASLWPAAAAARTEPLALLQSGRSAT